MALRKSEEFLNFFWGLAESDDSERIEAVVNIINALKSNVDDEDEADLRYTVERLVRGLTSERKSARLGFFTALTLALKTFDDFSIDIVFELGDKHLQATEKNEKRSCIIGHALLYAALIRSDSKLSDEQLERVAKKLLSIGSKKFYLEAFISNILQNFLEKIEEDKFAEVIFPIFEEKLSCGWESGSPFIIWLLFLTSRLFPNVINKAFLKANWGHKGLINKDTCNQLAHVIMKSTSAHPKIHSVCIEILSAASESKIFDHFWTHIVDYTLISAGKEKIYLSFELVKFILPKLKTADDVKSVLKANLMRQFIQNLSHSELPLNNAAKKLAEFLVTFVSSCENSSIQSAIVTQLMTRPGTILFDKITKTKTISSLFSQLKSEALEDLTTFLMTYVSGNSVDGVNNSVDADDHRLTAAKQLENLFKHKAMLKNWEWKRRVINFFVQNAFFDVKNDKVSKPISSEVREYLTACLLRMYGQLTSQTFGWWKPNIQELFSTYYETIELCNNLLKDSTRVSPVSVFDDEVMEHWKELWKMVKILHGSKEKDDSKTIATENSIFEVIYLQMMLFLLVNPDEIIPLIKEVEICYEKAKKCEPEDENNPGWVQVLVDIILSFVSKAEKKTFQCIVDSVFHLLVPRLTVKTTQQILNVLSPNAEDILVDEDEDDDDDDDEEEESDGDETNEDEEDASSSDDNEPSDEESNKNLENAARIAIDNDADESDIDLDEVDQAELDKKDAIFSALFKSRKSNFQAEYRLRNFRLRCLNLLHVIVDVYPTVPVICSMIVPVLEVIVEFAYKNQESRMLHIRAEALLRRLVIQKEFKEPVDPNEKPDFLGIWNQIVGMSEKITNLLVTRNLSDAITLLTRCMKKWTPSDTNVDLMNELVVSYKALLNKYFEAKNSHIHLSFISSFLDKNLDLAGEFIIDIIDFTARDNVRLFRKSQGLGLVHTIMNHVEVLKNWELDKWDLAYSKLDNCVQMSIKSMGAEMKPTFASNLFKVYWSFYQQYKRVVGKPFKLIPENLITPIFDKLPKPVKKIVKKLIIERERMGLEIDVTSLNKRSKKRRREAEQSVTTIDATQQTLDEIDQQIEFCEKKTSKKRRKSLGKEQIVEEKDIKDKQIKETSPNKQAAKESNISTELNGEIENENSEEMISSQSQIKRRKSTEKDEKVKPGTLKPKLVEEISPLKRTEEDLQVNANEKTEIVNIRFENGIEKSEDSEEDEMEIDQVTNKIPDKNGIDRSSKTKAKSVSPENEKRKKRKLENIIDDKEIDSSEKSSKVNRKKPHQRLSSNKTPTKSKQQNSTSDMENETTPVKTQPIKRPTTRSSAQKMKLNGDAKIPVVAIKRLLEKEENDLLQMNIPTRTRRVSESSSIDMSQALRRSTRIQSKRK